MVERGLAHNVTSDAHDHLRRPPSIEAELDAAGIGGLAPWLVDEVPAAILAGEDIPPRPQLAPVGRGRGGWWRIGR
jgi:protein-tyrosine phosphatase